MPEEPSARQRVGSTLPVSPPAAGSLLDETAAPALIPPFGRRSSGMSSEAGHGQDDGQDKGSEAANCRKSKASHRRDHRGSGSSRGRQGASGAGPRRTGEAERAQSAQEA